MLVWYQLSTKGSDMTRQKNLPTCSDKAQASEGAEILTPRSISFKLFWIFWWRWPWTIRSDDYRRWISFQVFLNILRNMAFYFVWKKFLLIWNYYGFENNQIQTHSISNPTQISQEENKLLYWNSIKWLQRKGNSNCTDRNSEGRTLPHF